MSDAPNGGTGSGTNLWHPRYTTVMIPDRSHIRTEQPNPASSNLDDLPIDDAVALMNAEDAAAVAAVKQEHAAIARAVKNGRGGVPERRAADLCGR